jgi:hypothetical protein
VAAIDQTSQTMLAMAAICYRGYNLVTPDKQMRRRAAMNDYLKNCSATKGWEIVWGPCGSPAERFGFDEDLMYVAQNRDDPSQLAIAIRGTDPISLKDWIEGDFELTLKPWKYGNPPPKEASISESTMLGLDTLSGMRDPTSNGGQTLKEFIRDFLREKSKAEIYVTGHSKGGPLSSTLALWLADTQKAQTDPAEAWDSDGKATVFAYSFAGPTAGNGAFAEHSDLLLGPNCHRIWNSRDIAPRAFVSAEMMEIPDVYQLRCLKRLAARKFIARIGAAVQEEEYRQICGRGTNFDSALKGGLFLTEIIHQHLDSYLKEYELIGEMSMKKLFKPL